MISSDRVGTVEEEKEQANLSGVLHDGARLLSASAWIPFAHLLPPGCIIEAALIGVVGAFQISSENLAFCPTRMKLDLLQTIDPPPFIQRSPSTIPRRSVTRI